MKNKKILLAFFISLLVGMIGGTLAYYTNTTKYTNELKTAKYKTTTVESTTTPITLAAGGEFDKTINTTNEGTIPVAVRASYTEQWYDADGNKITVDGATTININNGSWASEGNYYYYKYIVEPNDFTNSFIKSIVLSEELGSAICTTNGLEQTCVFEDGRKYVLTVAMQTINTSKYKNAWGTSVDIAKYPITYVTRQNEGQITTGDLIRIGDTEEFYVVSSDANTTVLLAHYNLNVGNNIQPGEEGIQNSKAIGRNSDDATKSGNYYPATLDFSSNAYWVGKIGEGLTYPGAYSNPDYPYVYDNNSTLYTYVENYKLRLENTKLTINKARVLSYQEAVALGCKESSYSCSNAPSWVYETSYWLGAAHGDISPWVIRCGGNFTWYYSQLNTDEGVRPVIEINTADIK